MLGADRRGTGVQEVFRHELYNTKGVTRGIIHCSVAFRSCVPSLTGLDNRVL